MWRALKWVSAGLGTALLLVTCTPVGALVENTIMNTITTTEFLVEGDTLYLSGEFNSKSLDQFNAVYAKNPGITRIVELQVGGSNDDDTLVALGYLIRELGLNMHLQADSAIYSGGVDLFLAGVERTMEAGAILGVHSWSGDFKDGADYPRGSPEHAQGRAYVEDMLGDDAFYWFTIYAAPADDIYQMKAAEIEKFGLLTAPIMK